MNFAKISTIPRTGSFCSLISSDELLTIQTNRVSIISAINGFCKYFYLLPQVPRLFAINTQSASRFAVVYKSSGNLPESVALLETETGKVIKQFALKSTSQKFLHIALGSHLFFVTDSVPGTIYLTQPTGTQISTYDANHPIKYLAANPANQQFIFLRGDNHLIVADALSLKQLNDIPFNFNEDNTRENPFSLFITFKNSTLTYGLYNGDISTLNLSTGENKSIKTPHSTAPLACEDNVSITSDGILFSTDTGETIATISSPVSLRTHGSTIAVVCKDSIEIYESAKRPICTVSQLQPPEPFVGNQFSVSPTIYFSASTAIYSFNLSLNEISKFTSFQEKIKKIATCQACVSVVYNSPDGDKIATFSTGVKKRDELGIDVLCDTNNVTWILQKDFIISYRRKSLDLEEIGRIPVPADHTFNQLFRLGKTVGVYSPNDGYTVYIKDNQLIPFTLPKEVSTICWPALCMKDKVYICKSNTDMYEKLTIADFVTIQASVTSCCWLAKTLFAVENRKVLALSMDGSKRVVDRLPNSVCSIASAVPFELIFVTTLPSLRVVSIKRPFIFIALLNLGSDDTEVLKSLLSYMPSLPIDPRAISGLKPIYAMSVFNKAPPKFVTPKTVSIYARFARFNEVLAIAKASLPENLKRTQRKSSNNNNDNNDNKDLDESESTINDNNDSSTTDSSKNNFAGIIDDDETNVNNNNSNCIKNYKKIIKLIADAAYNIGQFTIAQQIYEELGDSESLFALFMSTQNVHNLKVLAMRSNLKPSIAYFGINPPTQEEIDNGFNTEYELPENLQLPKIKSPYTGNEFTLYAGDPSDDSPLWPPSFDEPSDFGLREFPLTGEEAEQEIQMQSNLDASNAADMTMGDVSSATNAGDNSNGDNANPSNAQGQQIQYKERPVKDEKKEDDDLKLDKFFEDDDDEPEQKKISFEIDMKKAPARRGTTKNFSLTGGPAEQQFTDSAQIPLPVPQRPRNNTVRMKKFTIDIPGINPNAGANEAPVVAPGGMANDFSAIYRSEEITVPNFRMDGSMNQNSNSNPNIDLTQDPNSNNNINNNNSESENHSSSNVADQFTSNIFMDML